VYYNLTITGLSIAIAVTIGAVELLGLVQSKLGLDHGLWSWISGVDLNTVGFLIVGLFCVTWAGSVLVWRFGRIEEKWGGHADGSPVASES